MKFDQKLLYLGDRTVTLQDGSVMHGLSFFDGEDQSTLEINVMASNQAVCSVLPSLSFGAPCKATLAVRNVSDRQSGKSYCKLALVEVAPVSVK